MAREELVKVPAVILGNRLRAKRKSMRMSQHQLGGGDFSPSYVSAVERGKIRPSLKALYILSDRLGEPVTYFLQDEGIGHSGNHIEEALDSAAVAIHQGRTQDALDVLGRASLEGQPHDVLAKYHLSLGRAHLAAHQPAEAIAHLQDATHLAESSNNEALAAQAGLYQGMAYYEQNKPQLAYDIHRRCLSRVTSGAMRDVGYAMHVYQCLGEDLIALDQQDAAVAFFQAAIDAALQGSSLRALGEAQWRNSLASLEQSNVVQARAYAHKSLAAFEALDVLSTAAALRNTYATVMSETSKKDVAVKLYNEAHELAERIGEPAASATSSIRLGELAAGEGEYTTAEEKIMHGVDIARSSGDALLEGQGLLALANVRVAQDQRQPAEEAFRAAMASFERVGAGESLGKAYFRYGQALVNWGQSQKGSEYLERAYLQARRA